VTEKNKLSPIIERKYWNIEKWRPVYVPVSDILQLFHTFDNITHLEREALKELKKQYDKTEDDLKALQSVGQIIGEVLKQLDEERCMYSNGIFSSNGFVSYCQSF
jgi:ATP-dependent 26S proteasome regulatory subunit